jgi:hypothetical protein
MMTLFVLEMKFLKWTLKETLLQLNHQYPGLEIIEEFSVWPKVMEEEEGPIYSMLLALEEEWRQEEH